MFENAGLYQLYEWQQTLVAPLRIYAHVNKHLHSSPLMPWAYTGFGRTMTAGFELLERVTKRYTKPEFRITETRIDGEKVAVTDEIVFSKPFCQLRHFKRAGKRKDPAILVVAPMSGHHATLLRGTVAGLLPYADVYITDWVDAREVPVLLGKFDLDDYITYLMEFMRFIGKDVHTVAVCQPAVPLYAAVALMSEDNDPYTPRSMTLMGGPIDTRRGLTQVNQLAMDKPLGWFEQHVITRVPANYPGFMRRVYPGFLQLSGFMQMNLDRHIGEHLKLFQHLVQGDGESATAHRTFYDEYLSVADLPAEFYLQTIDKVFQRQALPRGEFQYQDRLVRPGAIKKTRLLCIEGERDDISGIGQTKAAIRISTGLPDTKKQYYLQRGVGHYGIFNGRKYREFIVPVIMEHIRASMKHTP